MLRQVLDGLLVNVLLQDRVELGAEHDDDAGGVRHAGPPLLSAKWVNARAA
jgi:hypothetical protein